MSILDDSSEGYNTLIVQASQQSPYDDHNMFIAKATDFNDLEKATITNSSTVKYHTFDQVS